MKRVVLLLLAVTFLSTSCTTLHPTNSTPLLFPTSASTLKARTLSQYALERTVRLDIVCSGKDLGHGTGVVLRSYPTYSIVASAKHVLIEASESPKKCMIVAYDYLDAYRLHPVRSTTVLVSATDDIGVAVLPHNYHVNTPIARAQDLYPGMPIVTSGYPAQPQPEAKGWRVSPSVAVGSVSTLIFKAGNLVQLRVTSPLYYGYSGSGSFDSQGRLVGITSFLITNGPFRSVIPGYSYLVSSNRLRMFLSANRIQGVL